MSEPRDQTGIRIRPVRESDAPAIVALLNPIIEAGVYTILDAPVTVADQVDFLHGMPERSLYHAAFSEADGALLGIQDVVPASAKPGAFAHVGEISTFVALAHRGCGVGSALIRWTFGDAVPRGFRKLWATIRADNPGAVAFYRSQGFRIVGTAKRHARVRGVDLDEVIAERLLLESDR